MANPERRILFLSLWLAAAGALLGWMIFGLRAGLSFLAGAALAGGNLLWLRSSIYAAFSRGAERAKTRVLAGYLLRLLLSPLSLYVMIRFLFLDVLAAAAGVSVFVCSLFIEGVLEAFGNSPK
jgi:hypothetical protein